MIQIGRRAAGRIIGDVHQDRHHFGIVCPVTAGTQGRRQERVAIGEILVPAMLWTLAETGNWP